MARPEQKIGEIKALNGNDQGQEIDLVYTYFQSIGEKEILSREKVIELAKAIELGLLISKVLSANPQEIFTAKELIKTLQDILKQDIEENIRSCALESITALKSDPGQGMTREKLEALATDGIQAEHELILGHLRWVVKIAKAYVNRGLSFPDIIQEGNIGLTLGIRKFNWRRERALGTFVTDWIRQSIGRAIMDKGRTIRIPGHLDHRMTRLERLNNQFITNEGRDPSDEELAVAMKIDELGRNLTVNEAKKIAPQLKSVKEWRLFKYSYVSMDLGFDREDPNYNSPLHEASEIVQEDNEGIPGNSDESRHELMKLGLSQLLPQLPLYQQQTIKMRFGLAPYKREYTLHEIGEKIGKTKEGVRQITLQAISQLRYLSFKHGLDNLFEDALDE